MVLISATQIGQTTITKYNKLCGSNKRNLLSHSASGEKTEIEASAGLAVSQGHEGSVPSFSFGLKLAKFSRLRISASLHV